MTTCPDCGAAYTEPLDDCQVRFDQLLALDHSRREPWGSRHALAFAAFALQHPTRYEPGVLASSWALLVSVFDQGHDPRGVVGGMRRAKGRVADWSVPPLPPGPPAPRFSLTIADLGPFAADGYVTSLDHWCRAALAGWRGAGAT